MRPRFSFLCAGAVCAGGALAAEPITLPNLEQLVNAAPAVRLAEADRIAAETRQEVAVAAASPRLFVSGTVEQLKDPTRTEQYTAQTLRPDGASDEFIQRLTPQATRHTHTGAMIGLRLPLFGSREVIVREIDSSKRSVALQRLQEQVSRMEALKGLRYAYVDAYYRQAQWRLAQTYLGSEVETSQALRARVKARVALETDLKGIETSYFTTRHIASETKAAGDDALQRLQTLSGRLLGDALLARPDLPVACVSRSALENAISSHPDIVLHAAQLEHKRQLLTSSAVGLTQGGVSLSHGRGKQSDGGYGYSTTVAVDFSIPLFAGQWQRAQHGQAVAEVGKAQLTLDLRRQEYVASLGKLFGDLEARKQNLLLMGQRLESAKEAYRVSSLRSARLEADQVIPLMQAKFNAYAMANNHLDAEIAFDKAKIDVLGYGMRCDSPAERHPDVVADVTPILRPGGAGTRPARMAASGEPYRATIAVGSPIGWYAWNALKRFNATTPQQFWSSLPAGARILLSLNGSEVRAVVRGGKPASRLRKFLQGAKSRDVAVELLLGDPNWALSTERGDLISLVSSLSRFPFAGVHLDLERMQLAEDQRGAWPDGIVDTVATLRETTAVPISLSLHPRDLRLEGLLERLKQAGLNEVTVMAYITDPHKVADMMAPLFQRHPGLRFSVAQSIEPILPRQESYASFSREDRAKAWRDLSDRLGQEPNFAGIIIQSLEDDILGAIK
jgi:outer membrane protein TolC